VKVHVDELGCTGGALCEGAVPEVFAMGPDGLATVVGPDGELLPNGGAPTGVEVPDDLVQAVRDAAEVCPGRCIICTDA
jgi:ferredoxin